ncbi:MAG: alpha-glucosidase/alpha-galactosidase [Anaerolineaceae bacterium]
MPKITIIGAGSTVFTKNFLGDILLYPELSSSTICLMDIDPIRLSESEMVAKRLAETLQVKPQIIATTNRTEALEGASYVICTIQVGGYQPATVTDFEIPKKYGLRQTIGDTLGIGGIMRGLRTIPVLLDICADMEHCCPDAWLLNYVNPMAINCGAIHQATHVKYVGLCHSVRSTIETIAEDMQVPAGEIRYFCAGINHMAFYLKLQRAMPDGSLSDLYPVLQQVVDEGRIPFWNQVRYELFKHFGYFVTESSEHLSEYVPWYIKRDRPDLIERLNIPLDEYPRRCEAQIAFWEYQRDMMLDPTNEFTVKRSGEYGSEIIHSIETNTPRVINGNVANQHLIDNLPTDAIVEVPCVVDGQGIQPTHVGILPTQLAALMQTNINVQLLTVEAALTRKKQTIYQAAMLDPHTAAELDPDQICQLVDDLIAAHGEWLPKYQ